jgi:AbrB family looped-hinge helix DNA binding protein
MREIVSTVTHNGQVTIPIEVRRRIGVGTPDKVAFVREDEGVRLKPARVGLARLFDSVPVRDVYGKLPYNTSGPTRCRCCTGRSVPMPATTIRDERTRRRSARRERLEKRVSSEERALLQRAADLENRSLTEFVRTSAGAAATETIRRHETMVLSARDSAAFVDALMNPPAPGACLRAAAAAHRDLIGE